MPGYAARRVYTADIHEADASCAVKLYDATFLADAQNADAQNVSYACRDPRLPQSGHAICHQFLLRGDANALNLIVSAEDDGRGAEIWEALPDGFLLEIVGHATGAML